VLIDGIDVTLEPERVRRIVGYMPDHAGVYERITVREFLEFFADAYRIPELGVVDAVIELTELTKLEGRLVATLSKGMKQRLQIARTLLHDPKVLVLDEPASDLDPRARIEVRDLLLELRELGKTIFLSSHILTELSDVCTSVGILERGQLVVAGPIGEIAERLAARREAPQHVAVAVPNGGAAVPDGAVAVPQGAGAMPDGAVPAPPGAVPAPAFGQNPAATSPYAPAPYAYGPAPAVPAPHVPGTPPHVPGTPPYIPGATPYIPGATPYVPAAPPPYAPPAGFGYTPPNPGSSPPSAPPDGRMPAHAGAAVTAGGAAIPQATRKRLKLRVLGDAQAIVPMLEGGSGVFGVEAGPGGLIVLHYVGGDQYVAEVVRYLVMSGVGVVGVEPERNELERIFLEVTRGELT